MIFILLLAISLSIDALGVGISYGVRNISTPFFTKCILMLESIFFMLLFLFVGNHMTLFFSAKIANMIGILLLLFMGLWLCYESLQKKESDTHTSTELLRNPCFCDKDNSMHIDAKEAISLGFILSIDSMGAGIGAGAAHISTVLLPFYTALFQIIFLSIGIYCGKHLKNYCNIKENIWSIFSGCILIIIAMIRFSF